MAVTTFAAIDIGSYEISMKIFEFSKKIGFRELNDVRYRLEIGKGAYSRGRLEPEMVDDICVILKDFSNMMQEFGVSEYRACATSAFREIVNPVIVQEQIYAFFRADQLDQVMVVLHSTAHGFLQSRQLIFQGVYFRFLMRADLEHSDFLLFAHKPYLRFQNWDGIVREIFLNCKPFLLKILAEAVPWLLTISP
jgi:hypothetical protein